MEFKNRKFKFMDSVYTIRFVDQCELFGGQDEGGFNFGIFDPKNKTITISTKNPDTGKPFPKDQVMQTLRHELMHMVMFEGQYLDSYADEPLVEWLGKALGILLKNKILE